MASGNLTPRQKMINMMYLVLTAMLALNVSKDILLVLHKLDTSMEATSTSIHNGTESLYALFEKQYEAGTPAAKVPYALAQEIRANSNTAFNIVQETKDFLIEETGGRDPERDNRLVKEDDREAANNYLMNDESVGGKGMAKKIKAQLETYRDSMIAILNDPNLVLNGADQVKRRDLIAEIQQEFNFSDVKQEGKMMTWEAATFSELPLAGIIPFLTDLGSRVRRTEARAVELLFSSIGGTALKFDGVKSVVMYTRGNTITAGGDFEAELFLAAYNNSDTLKVEGLPAGSYVLENGIVKYKVSRPGIGAKNLEGKLILHDTAEYPFNIAYNVSPSNCVISPTKMNVLYKGVDNPIAISVAGVPTSDLIVSGPGLSGSNGNYTVDVTRYTGREAVISVKYKDADGSIKEGGSQAFRVYQLPEASGTLNTIFPDSEPMMKNTLANINVGAKYKDFIYDLTLSVTEFEVKISGKSAYKCVNGKLSTEAQNAIKNASRNTLVAFRNIKARTPKGGETEVADFVVEVL